jgi:hypothetical protein
VIRPSRATAAIGFAWLMLDASALRAAGICGGPCASEDLECRAELALCQAKISAYAIYMDQIDTGQPKYPLPEIYQEILRPHYPQVDFGKIRFAYSDQQPPDNATTDCDVIYFNDARYVSALRDAGPNDRWTWLLHELEHPAQCAAAGGREGYAKRWWSELETAVRESGETIDLLQSTEQLAKQLQGLYVRVHASMPMERAADARAEAVLQELRRCCIAPDGTPIRPTSP